jgi:hypothetical protein
MITWNQVAATLHPDIVCEITGGHEWDIYDTALIAKSGKPLDYFPMTECKKCGKLDKNPYRTEISEFWKKRVGTIVLDRRRAV